MSEVQAAPGTHSGGTNPVAVWLQAVRAPSLTAAVMPVLLGTCVAARDGYFSAVRLILALLGAMAIQAGTNLINDYYDYQKSADSADSLGPSLAIQQGKLSPSEVWWGGVAFLGFGSILGLILVLLCGWPILLLGLPSIAAAYFYTADPVALAYIALGEITVFVFMGPVIVLGAYYVMALHFSLTALATSIPIGFLVAGILHANNIRDIESDRLHHKRTVATLLGRRRANFELALLDGAAYATVLICVVARLLPWTALATLITVPRARDELRIVFNENEPRKLNLALFRAVQLHLEFGLVMILSILLAWAIGK
jgi:1,4-dihydroxy-2-naphthoate octaprenyltransferase